MSTLNSIKHYLTNKNIVHVAMLAFAVTSTLNVAGFFVATHHHVLIAGSIGLALGAGLMAVSIYLSNQDMNNRLSFGLMAFSAVALALLSGQIQSMNYKLHGLEPFTAYLLGYAPPIIVEILLALSVSLAERNERERVRRDSKRHIQDSVATAMTDAFRDVDAGRIKSQIEHQVDAVIKAFVDDALGEMMAELQPQTPTQTPKSAPISHAADNPINATRDAQNVDLGRSAPATDPADRLAAINAERQAAVERRRLAIMQLLRMADDASVAEIRTRLTEDMGITAGDSTIRNDLAALAQAGDAQKLPSGRWATAQPIAIALPTVTEPVLNGHGH